MDNTLPNIIATIGGTLITLILAYAPGLKERWEQLDGGQKRMALGVCYLAVSAGLYVPSCFGGPQVVACDASSIWDVVMAFVLALMAGQGAYTVLPTLTKERMSSDSGTGDIADAA